MARSLLRVPGCSNVMNAGVHSSERTTMIISFRFGSTTTRTGSSVPGSAYAIPHVRNMFSSGYGRARRRRLRCACVCMTERKVMSPKEVQLFRIRYNYPEEGTTSVTWRKPPGASGEGRAQRADDTTVGRSGPDAEKEPDAAKPSNHRREAAGCIRTSHRSCGATQTEASLEKWEYPVKTHYI